MPLRAPAPKQYPICPAGLHAGACIQIIDIGTHTTTGQYGTKTAPKVHFAFVIPGDLQEDGKPFIVSRQFTFSTHEKAALRLILGSWKGKKLTDGEADGLLLDPFLGKAAYISVVHTESKGKSYANMDSLMPLPKGMPFPAHECDVILFGIDDDPRQEIPSNIPKYLQEKIRLSEEWRAKTGQIGPPAIHPSAPESYVEMDPEDDETPF